MKRIIGFYVIFLVFFSVTRVYATDFDKAVPYFSADALSEITGYSTFGDLIENIAKGKMPEVSGVISKIINMAFYDIGFCFKYIISVLGISILSSCIKGVSLFQDKTGSEIAYLICYLIMAGFLLGILQKTVDIAIHASRELGAFVKMSLPAYVGIITSTGINMMANQAVFLAMINLVSSYAGEFMIKAFMYIGILTIISNMSIQIKLTKLIDIFRQAMFWVLGFLLTVFAGLTTLSGIGAAVTAGSGLRAIKYTVGHSVPLVGGFLADSAEVIMASAKIFKSAFGTGGIIIVFTLCAVPVLKLFFVGMILRFSAGLTEPFCDANMCDTIYQVGQCVIHIMVSLILVTVMFILAFAVLLICGGAV